MKIHKSFGLDLGTTNSTAAVVKEGTILYALDNNKSKTIPSIYSVNKKKKIELVGHAAKNDFYSGILNSKKSVKRDMGKDIEIVINNKKMSPEEISSKIIAYCRSCLEKTIDKENNVIYDKVVITVPAYFNLAQKDATRKAAELAGLEVVMLLEEPTSAAINFAVQNNIENGIFFVFDLGGGTFDVSILEKTGSVPQVLATAGNNFLGGDNFDMLLARHFLEQLESAEVDVSDVDVDINNPKFRTLLLAAEYSKIKLTTEKEIEIYYTDVFKDLSGRDLYIPKFTQEQFNQLIKEKIEIDTYNECEKALKTLSEKYGKTIEDITHILMVGGSSKIPYVQQFIKEKYCKTNNLKDVICYEPDLSVGAGAALVANSLGYVIEDEDLNLKINVNAPYVYDGQVYFSGNLLEGNVKEFKIKTINKTIPIVFNEDNSFLIVLDEEEYNESIDFIFVDKDKKEVSIANTDSSSVDIIAPTPVQNETIAVEIIDIEKGKIEKYTIVESGATLPNESIEYFKINEHSSKEIRLPIWEGPRKIFDLVIDVPENTKIGSKISVTTKVDMISNISLEVKIDNKILVGRYEYIAQADDTVSKVEALDEMFEERISYISDEKEKERLIEAHEDIQRELGEAANNNDMNHFTTVSEKYEKVVAEMPVDPILTEEQFDKIGEEIKSQLNDEVNFDEDDVDNVVFYGKRFIKKDNMEEAKKCMDELKSMKETVELFNSPAHFYNAAKGLVIYILRKAIDYTQEYNANPTYVKQIEEELKNNHKVITEILEKYNEDDNCPNMKQDGQRLIEATRNIYLIIQKACPEQQNDENMSAFKGLVSKA